MRISELDRADPDITPWRVIKWVLVAFVVLGIGGGVLSLIGTYLSAAGSVASAPARVIQRTMNTSNIVNQYDYFFRTEAEYRARVSSIAAHKRLLADETNNAERSRLRIELAGMQQNCREMATSYSNRSIQLDRGIFRDWRLPESLDQGACN